MEIIDEFQKPTSGEEIDADFSETVKCFSFNVTGESKITMPKLKNKSVKYKLNVPVDEFEDSIN
jgi:hypothetical protein